MLEAGSRQAGCMPSRPELPLPKGCSFENGIPTLAAEDEAGSVLCLQSAGLRAAEGWSSSHGSYWCQVSVLSVSALE